MNYLEDMIEMQTALVTYHEHSAKKETECKCRYCKAVKEFLVILKGQKKVVNHAAG